MAPPAPSSGRPRCRRRRELKNKSRVDEVGGDSGRKMTTHPFLFHNLLCKGPQTLIFVAAPSPSLNIPSLNIPKVVICIVIVVVVVCVFVVL